MHNFFNIDIIRFFFSRKSSY